MNFNAVRATPGTFVTMPAIPTGIQIKQGDYGPYAFASLQDDNGESIKILIGANDKSPLIQLSANGIRSKFGVKYDLNNQQYKAYYNGPIQADGQSPPPQGQMAKQPASPPQRDTGLSIERQACCKAAAHRYQGTDANDLAVVVLAEKFAYFVKTGMTYFKSNEDGLLDKPMDDSPPSARDAGGAQPLDTKDIPF